MGGKRADNMVGVIRLEAFLGGAGRRPGNSLGGLSRSGVRALFLATGAHEEKGEGGNDTKKTTYCGNSHSSHEGAGM